MAPKPHGHRSSPGDINPRIRSKEREGEEEENREKKIGEGRSKKEIGKGRELGLDEYHAENVRLVKSRLTGRLCERHADCLISFAGNVRLAPGCHVSFRFKVSERKSRIFLHFESTS